jgi:putative methanogenesis marker protein 8
LSSHAPCIKLYTGQKRSTLKLCKIAWARRFKALVFAAETVVLLLIQPVIYGASETMDVWLEKGFIDSAVVVCEGAGTVLRSNGKLVQDIGARLNGIIKTSPILGTIEHVEHCGGIVLDRTGARIDQVEGVKRAFSLGFKHIAVSIAGFQARAISGIRDFEKASKTDVLVFSVCNTRVSKEDVRHVAKADVV